MSRDDDKRSDEQKTRREAASTGLTRRTVLAGAVVGTSAAALGLLRIDAAMPVPRRKPRWIGHM